MNHILRAMEWLLGAIEHRAYQLRLNLYYHRTRGVPPKVRRIGNEVLQATPTTPVERVSRKTPPLILAHSGCCAPNSGSRALCTELVDAAITKAIADSNRMGEYAAAALAAAGYRIVQAGDTP